jgi:hypothetical protein
MEEAEAEAEAEEDRGGGRVGDAVDFREETKAVDAVLSPVPGSAAETEGDGVTEWSGLAGDDIVEREEKQEIEEMQEISKLEIRL